MTLPCLFYRSSHTTNVLGRVITFLRSYHTRDTSDTWRILFNIYTSEKQPLHVKEMNEVDAFMDALNPEIEVIWGVSDDNTLDDDAKVTILATGFDDGFESQQYANQSRAHEDEYYSSLIAKLYKPLKKDNWTFVSRPSSQELPDSPVGNHEPENAPDDSLSAPTADTHAPDVHTDSPVSAPAEDTRSSEVHRDNPASAPVEDTPQPKSLAASPSFVDREEKHPTRPSSSAEKEESEHDRQTCHPKKERGMSWLDRLKKKIEDMGLVDDMDNPSE